MMYAGFFKNLLSAGIMFPPSQFEAVFVSLAHTEKEIDMTLKVAYSALKEAK
jgi:glutamate-1-semialdehyde 2,1-aminomutase